MKKIGVIGVKNGWSSEVLADAIGRRTGFRCLIDMDETSLDVCSGRMCFGGLDVMSLDALVIKKISSAYSPDVMDRLEILSHLHARGLRVFSPPDHISRIVNRLSCTLRLQKAGIPIPETVITACPREALKAVRAFGKAVFKPLFTSKARGMMIIQDCAEAEKEIEVFRSARNPLMYIQKFINLPGKDLGITFLGGKYVATYARVKGQGAWSSTTADGGRYEAYEPSPKILALAHKAQEPFGLDFTCVDLVETPDGPMVFEVSAFGGFKGLLQANNIDAAELYADYVIRNLDVAHV